MRSEITKHRVVFAALALVMVVFVMVLLYLHPDLEYERLAGIAALILVAVAATAFVAVGVVEETIAYQFGRRHKRELIGYLVLGLVSIASGLFLAFSETASLQTVSLVVAPHALLFGAGELRMAQHLHHHPAQRRALILCGVSELALALLLTAASTMATKEVATCLGFTAIISLLQILPMLLSKGILTRVERH